MATLLARSRVEFLLQTGVGAALGLVGGRALLWFMCRVWVPGLVLGVSLAVVIRPLLVG